MTTNRVHTREHGWRAGPAHVGRSATLLALITVFLIANQLLAVSVRAQPVVDDETSLVDTVGEPFEYFVELSVSDDFDGEVDKAVRGASALWRDRDKPASGSGGLLATARGDYKRILAALYAQAHYGGVISITVNGREAANILPGDPVAEPANVLVSVNAGPAFVFGETVIVNPAPPPADRDDFVPSPESEGFYPGAPAFSGTILKAETLSVEAWREQGYAKAKVRHRNITALHDSSLLDASIELDPGRKAFYGTVAVDGTRALDPDYLVWMTDLPAGREYDPGDIEKAYKRLNRLGVFRSLRIVEAEEIQPDGTLPVGVFVQERLPRRIGLGASFDTVDGAGVEGYWLHRNLFGRAEQLRFDLRIGGVTDSFDPGEYDYRFATTFTRPGTLTPDTDQVSSFVAEREVLDAYTKDAIYGETGFRHRLSDKLTVRAALNGGVARFDDDVFGQRHFANAGVLGGATYDSRDSQYDPTRGVFLEGLLDPYYEFKYGNAVGRLTAEGRTYLSLDPQDDRFVAAGRVKVGTLFGSPISETAPDKLFFAGGGGSVRGYAYRNIGVPVPGGEIIGGRSLAEGSVELRARLSDTIGFAAFADAGYVDANPWPDFSNSLRVGVGAGLRYYTGFAPIRLDVAFPLDRRDGDPSVAFYVGLGQAF